MRLMRRPSLLLVFLFLVAVAHAEIPEHIRLGDDISNDFTVSACGRQSVQPRPVNEEGAPASGSVLVEVVPARTVQDFRFSPSDAEPFHLSGQDRLLFWSVQRT